MEDDVKTLGDYLSIAWRRKFYILIPFILALFIATVMVLSLPRIYQSSGTILIESQQIPEEMVQSMVTGFAAERIQVIQQHIMSGEQLFSIIKKFNLYAGQINKTARSEILGDMRERIAIDLESADVRNWQRGPSAVISFTVSFEDQDPAIAQKVTNELVTLFLDKHIKARTARAEETTEFLTKESERLGNQITIMEEQIASYKQENVGSLPEDLAVNLQRIVTLKSAVMEADAEINRLIAEKNQLQIEVEALQQETIASGGLSAEQQQQREELQNLQNQYISLSARYGSEHPDVKAIKRQITAFENEYGNLSNIDELQEQGQDVRSELLELAERYSSEHPDVKKLERKLDGIETMIAEFDSSGDNPTESRPNPELLRAEARMQSIESNIDRNYEIKRDIERQIEELNIQVIRAPQVERGLDALERDYENIRNQYRQIKAKKLEAELALSLEEEQKGERFTLLEPPQFPESPIKPNRKKLFLMGFVLSLMGGIGVAGLAEILDGGIRGSRALAAVTKMTPLVTIPYIRTRQDEVIKKRNIKILIAMVVILGILVLAMVHFLYKPLDLIWFILLRKLNMT